MIIDAEKLRNSALSGLLFLSVFHTISQAIHSHWLMAFVFLTCSTAFVTSILSLRNQQQSYPASLASACSVLWLLVSYLYADESASQNSLIYLWLYPIAIGNYILLSARLANCLALSSLAISSYILFDSNHSASALYQALPFIVFLILLNIVSAYINHLQAALKQASTTDALTGCVNAEHFKQHLKQAATLSQRYQTPASCLVFFVDADFDKYRQRESLLKEVAQVCQSRVRQSDVVCRYSDQRFLLLLPNTHQENASKLALDLVQACEVYQFSCLANEPRVPKFHFELSAYQPLQSWESWFQDLSKS